MFEFKTEVRLYADADPAQIAARLSGLTAAPLSFARPERFKPLRGKLSTTAGFLRWPMNEYRIVSPRILKFAILDAPGGSVLSGAFKLLLPLRIGVLLWLACGNLLWGWTLIHDLVHRSGLTTIGEDLLFLAVPWGMGSAYLWAVASLGKRRDRGLIRTLRVVLASEAGAGTVKFLLSSDEEKVPFVDSPNE